MTPDPEQERVWRERVETLFAAAPEPDPGRLATALSAVRARRRRSRHRTLAVLAGAVLLGGGMATAAWWASGSSSARPERDPADGSSPNVEGSMPDEERRNDESSGPATADDGIIYQRAD